jgi:hypothetical protein
MSSESKPVIHTTSIAELANAVKVAVHTKTPLVALSAPGLGKTTIVKQTAQALGYKYAEAVIGSRDIGSLMMPYVTPGNGLVLHYNPVFPIIGNKEYSEDTPVLINFDEVDKSSRLNQSFLLKALDEWKIGEARLRDDVVIVATGNRAWDMAGSEQFNAALANRATMIHFELDVDFWLEWAMQSSLHPLVQTWVKFDVTNLFDFNPQAYMAGDFAFPSPRSNEKLSRIMYAYDQGLMSERLFRGECCGTIGMAKGIKFVGFIKIADRMPDTTLICEGKTQPVVDEPAVIYATMAALIARADKQNLGNICRYIDRVSPEWHLLFTKSLSTTKPALVATPHWSKWLIEHTNTLSA